MKKQIQKTTIIFLLIFVSHGAKSNGEEDLKQTINSVIGNISYLSKYGFEPDFRTDEDLRIKVHLEYVENILKKKNLDHLSIGVAEKRKFVLSLLHDYWTQGVFPKNYDYPGLRKPCFIDKNENICAVGYLIEQTSGRGVAKEVDFICKYDYVLGMSNDKVENWMKEYGLTKLECAMIQPTYDFVEPIAPEIKEPNWNGSGKHKIYDKNNQILMDGIFKVYKLQEGRKYVYDKNGILIKIELYKKGKYIGDDLLK